MAGEKVVRLAIVDENEVSLASTSRALADLGFETIALSKANLALDTDTYDLLLIKAVGSGKALKDFMHAALRIDPHLAIVVLVDSRNVDHAIEFMKWGATDFLTLPIDPLLTTPVLRRALEMRVLRLENQRQNRELQIRSQELTLVTSAVSHDLRAPLNRVLGFTHILEETAGPTLDSDARETLEVMKRSVTEMKKLIGDLITYQSVREGDLKLTSFDLSEICHIRFNALRGAEPHVDVRLSLEPDLVVTGDEELLSIVLTNLLSNSIKFSATSEKPVVVVGRDETDPRHPFFVSDNGIGFDPNKSDKLFVPFKRLHSSRDYPGSGLGLCTVERIIQRHGGSIWATSEVDKGATFFFTLGFGA